MFNKKRYFIILGVLSLFFFFLSFSLAFALEEKVLLKEPPVAAEITGEIEEAPTVSSSEQPPVAAEITGEIEEAPPASTEIGKGTIEEREVEEEPPVIKDDKIIELGTFGASLPELIEKEKEGSPIYSVLLGYKAVRIGDLSVCNQTKYKSACEAASKFLIIRRIAKNECGLIKESSFKDICRRLNKGSCGGLSGWEKDMCAGLLNGDLSLITKSVSSSGFKNILELKDKYIPGKFDMSREILACFSGFKSSNQEACEIILLGATDPEMSIKRQIQERFLCEIMFGKEDADKILERCAADFTYFRHARMSQDKKACTHINSKYLKYICANTDKSFLSE